MTSRSGATISTSCWTSRRVPAGLSRDLLQRVLHGENVLVRRYFYPGCHRMEPYRSSNPAARLMLPQTERLVQRVLLLPTGTAVGPEDIATICDVIRFAVSHAVELGSRAARSGPPADASWVEVEDVLP